MAQGGPSSLTHSFLSASARHTAVLRFRLLGLPRRDRVHVLVVACDDVGVRELGALLGQDVGDLVPHFPSMRANVNHADIAPPIVLDQLSV